eukprot:scaffold110759_cov70-Phaeocystis_antarctica.AAC.2
MRRTQNTAYDPRKSRIGGSGFAISDYCPAAPVSGALREDQVLRRACTRSPNGSGGEDVPAVLGGRRRRPARPTVRLPRLRPVDPRALPRAVAAHEPEGGRSLPLRPVHGQVPRCAERRASECTAPGRAREWPGHSLHLGYARLGAEDPGQVRRG